MNAFDFHDEISTEEKVKKEKQECTAYASRADKAAEVTERRTLCVVCDGASARRFLS